jgi:hypothetical protein
MLRHILNERETAYAFIGIASNTQLYYYLRHLGTNLHFAVGAGGLIAFDVLIDLMTSPTDTLTPYFPSLVICIKPVVAPNTYVNAKDCAIDGWDPVIITWRSAAFEALVLRRVLRSH